MNMSHACEIPRDTGYSNVCQICGVPVDAGYFDVASFKDAPVGMRARRGGAGALRAASRSTAAPCSISPSSRKTGSDARQVISQTPGYEWIILCNNQPRAPYLPTSLILNPWGYNALPRSPAIGGRMRRQSSWSEKLLLPRGRAVTLSQVGGRLMGRSWYNTNYGGAPNLL